MKKSYYLSIAFLSMLFLGISLSSVSQTAQIVQPTSTGIVWVIGNSYNVTWTVSPAATPVDVYYSTTDGSPWTQIGWDVTTTSVLWNTTGLPESDNYTIWININGATVDISNNPFELTNTLPAGDGEIHVEQPNVPGIQWEPGTQHGIYWTDDLVEPVKLVLCTSPDGVNFTEYTAQETGLPTSVEGSGYIWTVGADIDHASNYYIKVMSTTTNVSDYGDNPFAITDELYGGTYIDVLQPDLAGIQWINETTHLISWVDDLIEPVDVILCDAVGNELSPIDTDVVGSTMDWAIPNSTILTPGSYTIKIKSSNSNSSIENTGVSFTIAATPSGGTFVNLFQPEEAGIQWESGTSHLISWEDDLLENVKIQLWIDGGAEISTATAGLTGAQDLPGSTWSWPIPEGLPNNNYIIKVIGTVSNITGESSNAFEVTDTPSGGSYINIIQPNIAGIEWQTGTTHLISWVDDIIEGVNIVLYDNAGDPVDAAVSGIDDVIYYGSTWEWPIPNGLESTLPYTIKISSSDGNTNVTPAESANPFLITDFSPGGEITIFQPNGGEEWIKGNSYLISWTDNISEDVKIEVTDGTNGYQLIGNNIEGSTWTWNTATNWPAAFPDPILLTETYKIRVSSTNTNSTTTPDESDAPFSFVATAGGEVTLLQPNGGEILNDNSNYLISWNDELVENVYIKLYRGSVAPGNLISATDAGLPSYSGVGIVGSTHTWSIPEVPHGNLVDASDYIIRVESIYGSSYGDDSDATFTIADTPTGGEELDIIQPNGGEIMALNSSYLISWSDDVVENIDIDLVDANQQFITNIATDVPGSTYTWDIDDALFGVGTYKIYVYSTVDPANAWDYSNGFFTITSAKSFEDGFNFDNPSGDLVMYPNPASTQFTVAASSIIENIEVRNLLGQIIFSNNEVNTVKTSINISGFDAGLYIVNVIIEGNVVTKKLFVQ